VSHEPHRSRAPRSLAFAWLTVSDTRTPETDTSGSLARRLIEAAGHRVVDAAIVPDEPDQVRDQLRRCLARSDCDAVVLSGGTGISARDRTLEAVEGMLERKLPGFGELFRMLSHRQVGSAAMLSRAVGGVALGRPVFAVPGATPAVELALSELILPEIGHLVAELRKQGR